MLFSFGQKKKKTTVIAMVISIAIFAQSKAPVMIAKTCIIIYSYHCKAFVCGFDSTRLDDSPFFSFGSKVRNVPTGFSIYPHERKLATRMSSVGEWQILRGIREPYSSHR